MDGRKLVTGNHRWHCGNLTKFRPQCFTHRLEQGAYVSPPSAMAPPSFSYTFLHFPTQVSHPYDPLHIHAPQSNAIIQNANQKSGCHADRHRPHTQAPGDTSTTPIAPTILCSSICTHACMLPRSHEKRQKKTPPANPRPDSKDGIPRLTSTTTVSHSHSPPPPNPTTDGNAQPPEQQ